jgi:hypothetical protein
MRSLKNPSARAGSIKTQLWTARRRTTTVSRRHLSIRTLMSLTGTWLRPEIPLSENVHDREYRHPDTVLCSVTESYDHRIQG